MPLKNPSDGGSPRIGRSNRLLPSFALKGDLLALRFEGELRREHRHAMFGERKGRSSATAAPSVCSCILQEQGPSFLLGQFKHEIFREPACITANSKI